MVTRDHWQKKGQAPGGASSPTWGLLRYISTTSQEWHQSRSKSSVSEVWRYFVLFSPHCNRGSAGTQGSLGCLETIKDLFSSLTSSPIPCVWGLQVWGPTRYGKLRSKPRTGMLHWSSVHTMIAFYFIVLERSLPNTWISRKFCEGMTL